MTRSRKVRPELAPGTRVWITKVGWVTILGTEPYTTRAGSRIYRFKSPWSGDIRSVSEVHITKIEEAQ